MRQQNYIEHFLNLSIQQHQFAAGQDDILSPSVMSGILQNRLQECLYSESPPNIGYIDEDDRAFLYCDNLSPKEIFAYNQLGLECVYI